MSGAVHRLTCAVERRAGAFGVARLIMLSGVPVRDYGPDSDADMDAYLRVLEAARTLIGEHVGANEDDQ